MSDGIDIKILFCVMLLRAFLSALLFCYSMDLIGIKRTRKFLKIKRVLGVFLLVVAIRIFRDCIFFCVKLRP
jgi:small neutral amino acid transporter SnatA (MarC family)